MSHGALQLKWHSHTLAVLVALIMCSFSHERIGGIDNRNPVDIRKTSMGQNTERRVVITGLGVVASNGIGREAFWHATSEGVSGIKPIQRFPTIDLPIKVAGEVLDFQVENYIDRKLVNRTARMTHLVFAAVQEALQDARIALEQENLQRVGVVIANTFGGAEYAL